MDMPGWAAAFSISASLPAESESEKVPRRKRAAGCRGASSVRALAARQQRQLSSAAPALHTEAGKPSRGTSSTQHVWPLNGMGRIRTVWKDGKSKSELKAPCYQPACPCRRRKRWRLYLWLGKIPCRRAWQSTPVFLPGESHGQRSLVGYRWWGRRVGHDWSNLTRRHSWFTMLC